MKKIYCFDCNNTDTTVTIDQFQADPNQVVMKIYHDESVLVLQFDREEFHDLCSMRFSIDYPPTAKPDLSLVA
jgi:hypothetical protein